MMRFSYCCNLNPVFVTPEHHNPRPPYSQRLQVLLKKCKVSLWEGFLALVPLDPTTGNPCPRHQRRINTYRAKAMQALAVGISHHMHITTGVVCCSVEQLADYCGLSTVSEAGNRSITRASRAIQDFEKYGLLRCERNWDPVLGIWYPKIMTVTPLFIQMIGSNEQEWEAAKRQQQGYKNRGLLKHEQEQITPCEAEARFKERLKALHLKNRQERHERKRALKLLKKSREEQRHEICQKLTKEMSWEAVAVLGLEGVRKLVDRKISQLKKFVGYSPPD